MTDKIEQLIGNTPVFKFKTLDNCAEVLMKLENHNPGGSVKDRAALYMINDAVQTGILKEKGTIIEATSGNTGIGLAMIGVSRGYRVIIVMPDTMSMERRTLISSFGAQLILTEGRLGMGGAIAKAEELTKSNGYFMARQFENKANARAHYESTGPEIFRQTDGKLDAFVSSVGSGGTITGCGEYLKEKLPRIKIIAVEPDESAVLSGENPGPHRIQGIGAGFIPSIINMSVIDKITRIKSDEAIKMAKEVSKTYGLLIGISSGAAIVAAMKEAIEIGPGKKVLCIAPDTGERYLSVFSGE